MEEITAEFKTEKAPEIEALKEEMPAEQQAPKHSGWAPVVVGVITLMAMVFIAFRLWYQAAE